MGITPTIAIVGRPNVGKSTLFNRLIGKRKAIVSDIAGTTRDRLSQDWEVHGFNVILVDTGGLEYGKQENIEEDIQAQAKIGIEDADIVLFIIDTIGNLTVDDFAAADILRRSKKPVITVANKCDNPSIEDNIYNIYELGLGDPIKISALHKMGIDELESTIEKTLKELKFKKGASKIIKTDRTNICILGKPNAGKSSLVNALTGDERVIVSEIAGTTRDATDTELEYKDTKYTLIDTAGLRRPGKIKKGIEKFSSLRCITAIDRSDVVVLLIDGNEGLSHQDCHILNLALEKNKGILITINKIDLLEKGEEIRAQILYRLHKKLAFIPWAPVVFISAKNKKNTYEILNLSNKIMEERSKRIQTAELNAFLQKVTYKHQPASANVRKPKFFYANQPEINPPTFTLFFKNPSNLHFSYPRYLENEIRKEYGFNGTAIILKIKNKNKEE